MFVEFKFGRLRFWPWFVWKSFVLMHLLSLPFQKFTVTLLIPSNINFFFRIFYDSNEILSNKRLQFFMTVTTITFHDPIQKNCLSKIFFYLLSFIILYRFPSINPTITGGKINKNVLIASWKYNTTTTRHPKNPHEKS